MRGYKFSCFLADSIFSSDGIYPDPVGFLKATVDVVHKNGGVFIADEVQPDLQEPDRHSLDLQDTELSLI